MVPGDCAATDAPLEAWGSTFPWTCLIRQTRCCSAIHDHIPMVNDPCAIEDCREPLLVDQECYFVAEMPRDEYGREQAVCWRHVRPDKGPLTVPPPFAPGATGRHVGTTAGADMPRPEA